MKRLTTATIVCATLLGMCSLCAETGEGASAGEGNVWTLSDGYLQKDGQQDGWKIKASWNLYTKILLVKDENIEGSGILDWDDLILKIGEEEIEDLGVQVDTEGLTTAAVTEFRCNKMKCMGIRGFKGNQTLERVCAGGPRLTALEIGCLKECPKLAAVKFDFPNLRRVRSQVFTGCPSLRVAAADILNPAVTHVEQTAFYKVAGLTGELTLTNIQELSSWAFWDTGLTKLYLAGPLESISDKAFYNDNCAGITNATFDLAENATVHAYAFRGGIGAPFERIRFLRKPFGASSMTNMLGYVKELTDPKACQIRVSRNQWSMEERQASGWWRPATKEGGLSDEELAAKPQGCLGYTEAKLSDWPINGAVRRAWIVHEPSPYDKGGFCVLIR